MFIKAIFSVCCSLLFITSAVADDAAAIAQVQAKGGRVLKLAQK